MMLAGLRSLWTTPCRCAWSSASAIWIATRNASGSGSGAVLQSPRERRAVDVLHHQEDRRTVFADVVERADIRVGDAGDGAGFVAEPFDSAARRVHELAREQLDGDRPIESRIARTVDFTHAPGTERCQDLERAGAGAGEETPLGVGEFYPAEGA